MCWCSWCRLLLGQFNRSNNWKLVGTLFRVSSNSSIVSCHVPEYTDFTFKNYTKPFTRYCWPANLINMWQSQLTVIWNLHMKTDMDLVLHGMMSPCQQDATERRRKISIVRKNRISSMTKLQSFQWHKLSSTTFITSSSLISSPTNIARTFFDGQSTPNASSIISKAA